MSKTLKKLLLALVVLILLAGSTITYVASSYLVNYAIGRAGDGGNREVALEVDLPEDGVERTIEENRRKQNETNMVFLDEHQEEKLTISSADGLNLDAYYYKNEDSHRWAITIHGYRSMHEHMLHSVQNFYNAGYHVLAPDLRACGSSEGDYVGMGWLDKDDILLWIDWIIQQDPDARILVYGISMGGATTMMVSGEDTPDQVKVFVEDCGYSSVWDIFSSELKLRFKLPDFPILYSASMLAKTRAGYGFKEASAVKQLAKCDKPMLFIHGSSDEFVPYWMLDVVYDAKKEDNKKKLVAEGAGHGEAMYALGDAYWEEVLAFANNYIN